MVHGSYYITSSEKILLLTFTLNVPIGQLSSNIQHHLYILNFTKVDWSAQESHGKITCIFY